MKPPAQLDRFARVWRLCLAQLALVTAAVAAQSYRGFTIDDSGVKHEPSHEAIVAATREQIDIVHAVGLPKDILTFFESVRFELVTKDTFKSPTPGRYTGRGDRTVQVSAAIATTGHKPVLLHELLHAYHDQQVKEGFKNPDILRSYEKAKGLAAYAPKSHMMQNEKEYFACAATAYLFGVTAQEPFQREKVKEAQPDFHRYLQELFGPAAGSYAGSLKR